MNALLDIDTLLRPIAPAEPGGANLEYDGDYARLERAAAGRPERQVGDVIEPAEGPDWALVVDVSVQLLQRSKDLRVATHLVRGLLATRGLAGLASGLAVLRGLVEQHWPCLYPRLDEEDGDPTARINALAALCHRDMLQALRAAPLAEGRELGAVALKDLDAPVGPVTAAVNAPSAEALRRTLPAEPVRQALSALGACDEHLAAIAQAWAIHLPDGAPDFAELRRALTKARRLLNSCAAAATMAPTDIEPTGASAPEGRSKSLTGGELRSRDEVLSALSAVCAYYAQLEPASPVRPLVERCMRLVPMSFLDVVRELCPEALASIQTITGQSQHPTSV